ncbi:Serine/threonine-protein kinase GRIK2 [Camellia lanceoleosa]|uniref:Serine/threonine-protein kinase GRIK2 n=1 Tax=Camellia lanceoleosa TaxID=1840588 RepID=A0ACC0IV48_9ERIC|nr:Serine/threonine-protein kinase GRIK2 [Camellia lanceoleosa]
MDFCFFPTEYGDIKPDNLLVTAAGTVKIGDFSVSQVFKHLLMMRRFVQPLYEIWRKTIDFTVEASEKLKPVDFT